MSIILNSDSYKYSQYNQYPEGTEYVYSYIESRGGLYDETVFLGLQAFIKEYLVQPINAKDIYEAEEIILAHGLPFYREGWEYILKYHDGFMPVRIEAVPEGTVVGTSNVLATIVNTDPKCWWLTSFLETALLRAIWYPTTVATNSREIKKVIRDALIESADSLDGLDFKLHDFGYRGVSSKESAGLGGMAHLVNFQGTDNIEAIVAARRYYNCDMAGFSIPAMEHSTVTSWGPSGEEASFRNMLKKHAKPGGMVACVSDSYDIYEACEMWGTSLKQDVIDSGATIVIRPDSGHPASVVRECVRILAKNFGYTTNSKGFKVLNYVRVIQGDGITIDSIKEILEFLMLEGWSADNVAFGQGGALLQGLDRDTQKFAMKCSAIGINGEWHDVYKDPVTDTGKRSKRGRLKLVREGDNFITVTTNDSGFITAQDELQVVYDGCLVKELNFEEIRENAKISS